MDIGELPALFCGQHRNSPKLVGDTSRRHSSIPRGSSTDKGAPLAAPESSSILAFPEANLTIPENQDFNYSNEDRESTEPAGHITPISNTSDSASRAPAPVLQFLAPLRRRVREANSFDVIPNKQIERVNTIMKRSCHSLQVRRRSRPK